MPERLHTVTITGTEDDPVITFTCLGDRNSTCHSYPNCDCEHYLLGKAVDYQGHPYVPHEECWMQSWFDTDSTYPNAGNLSEFDYTVGMSGPIRATFEDDVEWEFIEEASRG